MVSIYIYILYMYKYICINIIAPSYGRWGVFWMAKVIQKMKRSLAQNPGLKFRSDCCFD